MSFSWGDARPLVEEVVPGWLSRRRLPVEAAIIIHEGVDQAVMRPDPSAAGMAPEGEAARSGVTLADFQALIRRMYIEKDIARGIDGTFMWLVEEVGELAGALRKGTPEERAAEFADVLAWLATIANVAGVDLTEAVMRKYGSGCPGCGRFVCVCPDAGKP
jgi:NTP pyrophosphatase (non-canonical NTP hydrolase)